VLGSDNLRWRDVHALVSELGGTFGPSLTLNNTSTYLTAALVETSARLMGIRPAVTRDEAAMSGRFYWYSSDAMTRLGYRPAPSREALAESLAWLIHRAYLNESVVDALDPDPRVTDYYRSFAGPAA
jgi:dihydroflavonol-4-reductase